MQNEVNGSSKWKGKSNDRSPYTGGKNTYKKWKTQSRGFGGLRRYKNFNRAMQKMQRVQPPPPLYFFYSFEDPQPIIEFRNWVKNWRIDSHAFVHGFRIWLCSLLWIPFCGRPGFRPPKALRVLRDPGCLFDTKSIRPPSFPLPRILGLIQMPYSCQGWSDSLWDEWRGEKIYSRQKKNLNFIFGVATCVICLYTPLYIRMNTSGHICMCVYMHAQFLSLHVLRSIPLSPCAGAYLYFYAAIQFFFAARTLFICMRNSFSLLVFVILRNKGFLIHICICIRVSIYPCAASFLLLLLFLFQFFSALVFIFSIFAFEWQSVSSVFIYIYFFKIDKKKGDENS